MKRAGRKREGLSEKKITEQVQRLLKERGSKPLEMARKAVLEEKIECKEAREALKYFITEYWQDLARPTLLSLCCEAVGGDPEITVPIAVPMILISGGIDIHDDIIDHSKTKRFRPTVYGNFGPDIALLAGDALLFKGLTLLHEAVENRVPAEKMPAVIDTVDKMFFELGDAEALELKFRRRVDITPDEYLRVVEKKAADVEAHTRISAILGGGSINEIEALGNYGRFLGMILILRDDLLDVTDSKETLNRIENECLPLPILCALQAPGIKPKLVPILFKKRITEKDVKTIKEITNSAQGPEQSQKIMHKFAEKALLSIQNINHNNNLRAFLTASCFPYLEKRL